MGRLIEIGHPGILAKKIFQGVLINCLSSRGVENSKQSNNSSKWKVFDPNLGGGGG